MTEMPAKVRQRISRVLLDPGLEMARVVCLQSLSPGQQGFSIEALSLLALSRMALR